jgi:hypothetical protein
MSIHLQGASGCFVFLTILIIPGTIMAVVLHWALWVVIVPLGLLALFIGLRWGRKREVTPQQFADELERHLLGTDGTWGWDDTTSLSISDDRLDRLRRKLWKFDSLVRKKRQDEFKGIIEALRRGEVPDVKDD